MSRPAGYGFARSVCSGCGHRLGPKRPRLATGTPSAVRTCIAIRLSSGTSSWPSRLDTDKTYSMQLKNRRTIRLQGPDATEFLHNLIPAPVLPLDDHSRWIATAFLNAKGRILHEIMLRKPHKDESDTWHLDVDANSASAVVSHIKKHKLRSKFTVKELEQDAAPWYTWPNHTTGETDSERDPRPGMGYRSSRADDASNRIQMQWEDYMIHRMLNGHAEGPLEVESGSALPQESNLDFYGGIDFHKGCYLGQELTIRTHHTGIVRKRILPVQIYADDDASIFQAQEQPSFDPSVNLPQPPHGANISKIGAKGRSGRSSGRWLRGYGNIGLALCRLETMTDLSLTAEGSQFNPGQDEFRVTWETAHDGESSADAGTTLNSVKVRAFVPSWLRTAINDSIRARSERGASKRQKELEDEEEPVD